MGNWVAGLAGGWHQPSEKVLADAEQIKQDAEKEKKKAEKYKIQAKDWADKRVATVGNQITEQKALVKEVEEELSKEKEKTKELAEVVSWYQKKFGKATENLPKLKK